MEFYCYSPSETFVVLTADQFVGRDDDLLEQSIVAYPIIYRLVPSLSLF